MPKFTAATLDGDTVKFPDDYRGKKVLLVFWATWCGPCRAEMPQLREVNAKYGSKGLVLLGVSLDRNPASAVKTFTDEQKLVWPQVYDEKGTVASLYGVSAIPALFLIDGDTGRLLAGGDALDGGELTKTLEKHLKS